MVKACLQLPDQIEPTCRVWVKLLDLASAWHAQLSFKMSAAVLISLSQYSSFVVSHPSNVGMSWSKDVVRFACCCGVHKVSPSARFYWFFVPTFDIDIYKPSQKISTYCANSFDARSLLFNYYWNWTRIQCAYMFDDKLYFTKMLL